MHICHVITRLIVGGAQENTLLTCEGLRARGHTVTLISGPTTGPEGSLVERARAGGYRFLELPSLVRPIRPRTDFQAYRALRQAFDNLRPDVVHTHSSKAGILGRLAAAHARVPLVVHTVHGMSFNRTQSWRLRLVLRWAEWFASRHCHRIVTVANAMTDQLLAARVAPRNKLQTVYSGMEVDRFDPSRLDRDATRAELAFPPGAVVVATVARLFRNKGYDELLPIMQQAAEQEPRLHFLWIGDGPDRHRYEAELVRRGLAARTQLTGLVPPEEIPRLLAASDLLAHASRWEGLPRAVVQAALMEVPAIAYSLDGTPEVIQERATGRLVTPGDAATFVAALVELARDADLRQRYGAAGRRQCLERFDWQTMVAQLADLYERHVPR
jgi:glycosyltransferase involved in cell wall biosynthesis